VKCVMQEGQWKSRNSLCYQSRVGIIKWLGPSLSETVEKLAGSGRKNIIIVPISFVTDHIETLHEINIEMRAHAAELGIRQFEMMPALNDHPAYIDCLADLTISGLSSVTPRNKCADAWNTNNRGTEPVLCPLWRK
jgi:protoporphyrin/coproporphyrin ferrochelatase